MKNINLLLNDKNVSSVNEDYFNDMNLHCLKNLLEDNEFRVFKSVIMKPLKSESAIIERQLILKDFYQNRDLLKNLKEICLQAQNYKFLVYSSVLNKTDVVQKLFDNIKNLKKSLEVPEKLLDSFSGRKIESKTLEDLKTQLSDTATLERIKLKVQEIVDSVANGKITYSVEFADNYKLKSAKIVGKYEAQPIKQKSLFGKNKRPELCSNEFIYSENFLLNLQIENLKGKTFKNLFNIFNELNKLIISSCMDLYHQLLFYTSAIKIIDYARKERCDFVFPNMQNKGITAKSLYDLSLFFSNLELANIVPNDFTQEKDCYYLISGVNQGGKTTFLRSIGIAQIFAQNGLPVFAQEYKTTIFDSFVSHFSKDEDEKLFNGKLAEELERFETLLPLMKNKALILLNESFATTTENDAFDISCDIIKAASVTKSNLFFVTHNFKLLKFIDELNIELSGKVKIKSLISKSGDNAKERSYKIQEGEPQEEIKALEFVL